ncbi:MAG: hypothetical protein CVV02_00280 [Firmicutes bacterium HGW-Firmicutes-7]|nr:MAG: hypothetical protein CVV02_00280 [Firmicutes bacterium HGW-Firmicutes-7]
MKRIKIKGLIACIISLSLCGCWDKIEINDRGFAIGIGLDKIGEQLQVTYTIPNLPVITGQGGSGEQKFVKISEGKTIHEANKRFNLMSSNKLTFDHTKIIILGKGFLQDEVEMRKALDYLSRSPDYALSLLVFTTDKTAQEILEAKPNSDEPSSMFIDSMFSGTEAEELNDYKTTLLDFLISLIDTKGGGSLPLLSYKDKEIRMEGITVIKDYIECCTLSLEQLIPYNWIRGSGGGKKTIKKEEYIGKNITYQISQIRRNVEFKKSETKQGLDINILLEMEGDIIEHELSKDKNEDEDFFDEKSIKEMEKELKDGMEEEVNMLVKFIQAEVGVDVLDLSKDLKIKEGKLWEEIKDNWVEYFASANIHVEIVPNIRRIGMTK